jgi:hypothetical protein
MGRNDDSSVKTLSTSWHRCGVCSFSSFAMTLIGTPAASHLFVWHYAHYVNYSRSPLKYTYAIGYICPVPNSAFINLFNSATRLEHDLDFSAFAFFSRGHTGWSMWFLRGTIEGRTPFPSLDGVFIPTFRLEE